MMITRQSAGMVLAGITSLFLACPGHGQETPTSAADKPVVEIGENWTYRVNDRNNQTVADRKIVRQIEQVDENTIRIRAKEVGQEGQDTVELRNRDWNLLSVEGPAGARTCDPFYANHAFPMAPGKTWRRSFTTRNSDGSQTRYDLEGQVIGWEKVTVPAGTFQALKVKTSSTLASANGSKIGRGVEVYWWAVGPAKDVKGEYREAGTDGRARVDQSYELMELKSAP